MSTATPHIQHRMTEWFRKIFEPDQVVEVRGLKPTRSRFFRADDFHLEGIVRQARRLTANCRSVYFTINGLSESKLTDGGKAAVDQDIVSRVTIFFDLDPKRPADVSSTDAEKALALAAAERMRAELRAEGWPEPILADSGNGYHLLYRIVLPADDQKLVKRCLLAASVRFGTAGVDVDRKVFNASRICKFYGTWTRKGESTEERPHRLSRVLDLPERLEAVPTELLEALADSVEPATRKKRGPTVARMFPGSSPGDSPRARYIARALADEAADVGNATPGSRNDQLNRSAFVLGQLIGPELTRGEVERHLTAAAESVKLGAAEIATTLASGIDAGLLEPRDLSHVGRANGHHHANGKPAAEPSSVGPPPDEPVPPTEGDDEPEVERPDIIITTEEHEVIDQAVEALAADPTIYQRCNKLVTVLRDASKRKRLDPTRPAGTPQIAPLPAPRLRERMTKFARWCKRLKTRAGTEIISSHPTEWAVAGVACRGEWPAIRNIEGVIEAPTIRADGSILDEPGWDAETSLVYEPNCVFPAIPKNPGLEDAKGAAGRLLALVSDFPFTDEHHRVAWLSAVLTPLARWAIDGPTPLFLFDANTPGVGKSKLADLVAILATGRVSVTADYPDKEEEMAKSLLSIALAADRLVLFDNVSTGFSIGGKSLDRVLTSGMIKGRVLGRSEWTPALPVHTVFLATGNNLNLKGDALRRVVPCRLESEVERPEERKGFAIPDLLNHARNDRGALVVAALTILRAYILAGRPDPNLTPMDYRAWCGLIRNAVHWSTGLDPCKPRETLRENDPETNFRRALVHGWAELPGAERGLTVAEAIKHLAEDAEHRGERFEQLRGALLEKTRNGELPSRGSIGKLLGANKGRVVDGKALHQGDAGKHTIAWKVIDVTPAPRGGDSGDSGDIWKPTREKGTESDNTASGAIDAKHPHYHHYPHQDPDREVTEL